MSKTQVTQTALPPDERYVSRSGILQPNMAEVNRLVEARMPQHYKDEQNIGRTSLTTLENEVRMMSERQADREHAVASLTPQVADTERKVEQLRADCKNLTQAVAERVSGSRAELKYAQIKLKMAEDQLAAFQVRLNISTGVLASIVALRKEWTKVNGANLARLRKLTPDVSGRFLRKL